MERTQRALVITLLLSLFGAVLMLVTDDAAAVSVTPSYRVLGNDTDESVVRVGIFVPEATSLVKLLGLEATEAVGVVSDGVMQYDGFTLIVGSAESPTTTGDERCLGYWTVRSAGRPIDIHIGLVSSGITVLKTLDGGSKYYLPLIQPYQGEPVPSARVHIPAGTTLANLGDSTHQSEPMPYSVDLVAGSVVQRGGSVQFTVINRSDAALPLIVFGVDGRKVAEIGTVSPNMQQETVVWNPSASIASGIYFAAIDGPRGRTTSKKVVIVD